jgi:hypothetical protein
MQRIAGILLLVFAVPSICRAQNNDMFHGLDAWELTRGQKVQTTCEFRGLREVAKEYYCFASREALERFATDLTGNIERARVSHDKIVQSTARARGPAVDTSPLALQRRALYMSNIPFGSSALFVMNPASGKAKPVGLMQRVDVTDIAFNRTRLHGITFSDFLRVNATTGATTVVRDIGVAMDDLNALAYDVRRGRFLAAGVSGRVVTIDPTTGRGRLVGSYGSRIGSSGDLAFDSSGVLFATVKRSGVFGDFLAVVNRITGRATIKGKIGFSDVWGLAFRGSILFGATADGRLLQINPVTGAGIEIGINGITQGGMTLSP